MRPFYQRLPSTLAARPSIVGAVCDRAFFLELTKCGRPQTAPTVGNPSLRLLPRATRDRSGKALFPKFCVGNKELAITKFAENGVSGSISRLGGWLRPERKVAKLPWTGADGHERSEC